MKAQIWDLGIQTNSQGREMHLGAWEISENKYFVLSKDNLNRHALIERVQGQTEWHLTHQYIEGPIPAISIVDHTEPEILDSYLASDQGAQAVILGLCKYHGLSPQEMFMVFKQWQGQEEET